MSDYKLVPVEPTPEMLAAGKYALDVGCYSSGIYADMLATAPDVQGEQVYLYRRLGLDDFITCDFARYTELSGKPHLFETRVLYTTPQPSFQLPDFTTDPDDSDEGASLLDHGFKLGWNSCLEAVTKAMQTTQQPSEPAVRSRK